MIAVVTGAAGFIGSHLCEYLVAAGDEVRGVDSFTDYYPRAWKEHNLKALLRDERFRLAEGDLGEMRLAPLLEGADVVYHLAAQPGVRASWGTEFPRYVQRNLVVTGRLLDGCARHATPKLVYASSSSIYGDAESYPTSESTCPRPVSPYGVTKLAAEHLCEVYEVSYAMPTARLRLFTVYGPRQRPDMAFSRLVACAVNGGIFELYGDGEQTRDCTFVGDVITAMRAAACSDWAGVANIGGGMQVSLNRAIALVSEICQPVQVVRRDPTRGDVRRTGADTGVAAAAFGYQPETTLEQGLRAMVESEKAKRTQAT